MADQLVLNVVKPDGQVLSVEADEVTVPGALGSFGVLPGHAPFLTQIGLGAIVYRRGASRGYVAVEGGFCEIRRNQITVLAEGAERGQDIDVGRAQRARDKAAEHLKSIELSASGEEIDAVRTQLERARLRLQVAKDQGAAGARP